MLELLALAGLIGFFVAMNWNKVKEWLCDLVTKIKELFTGNTAQKIAHASMVIGEKIARGKFAIRHLLFYKEGGEWFRETSGCEVQEDQVPPMIRNKAAQYNQEVDITEEMSEELRLEI